MSKAMFRKKALKKLSSPEQLDELLKVTTPHGWLALLALCAIAITIVLWGIFGRIPTKDQGRVIGANATVQALRYCEQAGISIRKKRIWEDRMQLRRLAKDEQALEWLDQNVESFTEALWSESRGEREEAMRGLVAVEGPEMIPALLDVLKRGAINDRCDAAWHLGRLEVKEAIEPLIEALDDESSQMRSKAAVALGYIGDPRAVEPLIRMLNKGEYRLGSAAFALSMILDERAVMPLIRSLKRGDWEVKQYAALALGKLGDPRAIDPLIATVDFQTNSVPENVSTALTLITNARDVPASRKDFIPYWKSYRERSRTKK